MATLGGNAVISAEARLHPWLGQWVSGRQGVWLFEENNLSQLEEELRRHGQTLWQSHHMYLPETEPHTPEPGLAVQWYEREEILSLPGKESFPNALGLEPARPDMLAVAAVEEGSIAGLAGCSADTPEFWQIGIDVLPGHRGAGLGGKLVQLLKDEILRRGAIPIYGSGTANLHSQRIAAACGFYPAWVEIESIEKD